LKETYQRYNVIPVYDVLNRTFEDYPLANKPIAMAHAERNLSTQHIIFLDSDILCWHEPTHFHLDPNIDLMLSPDGTKTVASSGPGDRYEEMWQNLYQLAAVTDPPWTTTHLTERQVRSWWITSVIVSRRSSGLMSKWLMLFDAAMHKNFFAPEASYLREQMTLCAIAAKTPHKFAELPITHNFPVQNFAHSTKRSHNPSNVCLWHYQPFLNRFYREFATKFDSIDGLDRKLEFAEVQIANLQQKYPKLLGLDEPLLQKWRRDLRIGPRVRAALGMEKPTDRLTEWR
jgi:hypothetical protein